MREQYVGQAGIHNLMSKTGFQGYLCGGYENGRDVSRTLQKRPSRMLFSGSSKTRLIFSQNGTPSSVLLAPREGNALPDVTQIGPARVLLWLPGFITGSHNTQP